MKRILVIYLLLTSLLLSACARREETQQIAEETSLTYSATAEQETEDMPSTELATETVAKETVTEAETEIAEENSHILIAYFTRLANTESDLDTIVQGGGPYGEIGNSFAEADLDAISSASITIRDGEAKGNTQVVAEMIQERIGGDLFSITTVNTYPVDYDELIDVGGEERNMGTRPELVSQVENMDRYDIIFLGFPNWWHDMPMALYSFLEAYDLSGKTIIPFATSAGSGLSDTMSAIRTLQPEATVETGLHIPMRDVMQSENIIEEWLTTLALDSSN